MARQLPMPRSPWLKPALIIIAILVALMLAAIFLRSLMTQPPIETTLEPNDLEIIGSTPETTPVAADATSNPDFTGDRRRMLDPGDSGDSVHQAPGPTDAPWTVSHDVAIVDYKASLWADIRANPPQLTDLGDPDVDADLAYRLYTFYGNCSVIPRTDQDINQRLQRIAESSEHALGRYLESMDRRVAQTMSDYELCVLIPPEVDCRLRAVQWLTKAVELGHDVAEVQFYDRAKGFILRPDQFSNDPPLALQEPGLVLQFKNTARRGLARALEKGHPEAYLANSQALLEGLIYPKNSMEAYAYARAAELAAARNQLILEDLAYWKNASAKYLTEDQIADAEILALELQTVN